MDIKNTPLPVKRALKKLGLDLCNCRKKRRIPMQLAAERASISRATLGKIEKGDEGVSLGAYAKVLFVLGMVGRLAELVDSASDELGLQLDEENLPKRIRHFVYAKDATVWEIVGAFFRAWGSCCRYSVWDHCGFRLKLDIQFSSCRTVLAAFDRGYVFDLSRNKNFFLKAS